MQKHLITTNIILYCRKWEETIRFYKDGLHLPVNFSTEWFVEFQLTRDSRLSIADDGRSSVKSSKGKGITVALEVGAILTVWEYAERNGLNPTDIREHPWDAKVFYLFDPEGHRIEIWQAK